MENDKLDEFTNELWKTMPEGTTGYDDKYASWHIRMDKAKKREDCAWVVGLTFNGDTEEHRISFSSFGDLTKEKLWQRVIGESFASKLISLFKSSGINGVNKWIESEL